MDSEELIETRLYSVRWWMLLLTGLASAVIRFLRAYFGNTNDIFVAYFNVPYETVDWFTLVQQPGMIISSLILTFVMHNKAISVTTLAITMSSSLSFTCICLIVSCCYIKLYSLIVIGEFLVGYALVALDVVSTSNAINWFPEHQVGTALCVKDLGGNTGYLLAYAIVSNLLLVPNQATSLNQTKLQLTADKTNSYDDWFSVNQIRLMALTSSLLFISILIIISYVIFMKDKPPIPPTAAQALVSCSEHDAPSVHDENQLRKFLQLFKVVCLSKVFLQASFIKITTIGNYLIEKVFMGEILRSFFIDKGYIASYNSMSGWVLICLEIGSIFGSIIIAKLVDRYKNYRKMVIVFALGLLFFQICLLLGYYFGSTAVLFVVNIAIGTCVYCSFLPLYEIVLQHFYPADSGLLSLMIRIPLSLGSMFAGLAARMILNYFKKSSAVLIFMIILSFLSFITSLFLKPNYNRLNANTNSEVVALNEPQTPLLVDSNNCRH